MSRPNKDRINDVLEYIGYARDAYKSWILEDGVGSQNGQLALRAAVETIGEAINHISPELLALEKGIIWGEIIGIRNIVVHDYGMIDYSIIEDVAKNDLDRLESAMLNIKASSIYEKLADKSYSPDTKKTK